MPAEFFLRLRDGQNATVRVVVTLTSTDDKARERDLENLLTGGLVGAAKEILGDVQLLGIRSTDAVELVEASMFRGHPPQNGGSE